MKDSKINIVIPSVQVSKELIYCLKKLNDQVYKNFFVTIVLDIDNKIILPKLKYKLNKVISKRQNMSFKRNLGVQKFQSNLIAFLDSDAYPNKYWLKIANDLLMHEENKFTIFGGPSLPFPNQTLKEMLCYYAKRSTYVTGYLSFRKYKAKSRYCDWVESCCMFMRRELYLENGQMNIKKYLGEDKELITKMKKNNNLIQVFFTPKLFIYHKERNIKKFLLQRMMFGSDLFNMITLNYDVRSYQPILPLLISIFFISMIFINIELNYKFFLVAFFLAFIQLIILIDIRKYLTSLRITFLTLCLINVANISYAIGSFFAILGIKNLINRKLYLRSRTNT
tara:strand:- start:572 stop:1585 length:1014 start_codon:yes stop_codon:yes gene_type:complete